MLDRCSARAATSLPVPVSPVIRTVERRFATRSMISTTSRIGPLEPTRKLRELGCGEEAPLLVPRRAAWWRMATESSSHSSSGCDAVGHVLKRSALGEIERLLTTPAGS